MIEYVNLNPDCGVIAMTPEITYLQKPFWCHCSTLNLKMSILAPRRYYAYDIPASPRPCIVFFCGGAFMKQDRMVWLPELVFFAKHGYTVATVDYSTFAYTEFPEQLLEVKTAIRYLRAHAKELNLDPDRFASMGESAGGQLAAWVAVTGNDLTYKTEDYLEQSDAVQCCIGLYPVTHINQFPKAENMRIRTDNYPDTCELVNKKTPPIFLAHGLSDHLVPYTQSVRLHDKLQEAGILCELYLLDNADHSDPRFIMPDMQERILCFLNKTLME